MTTSVIGFGWDFGGIFIVSGDETEETLLRAAAHGTGPGFDSFSQFENEVWIAMDSGSGEASVTVTVRDETELPVHVRERCDIDVTFDVDVETSGLKIVENGGGSTYEVSAPPGRYRARWLSRFPDADNEPSEHRLELTPRTRSRPASGRPLHPPMATNLVRLEAAIMDACVAGYWDAVPQQKGLQLPSIDISRWAPVSNRESRTVEGDRIRRLLLTRNRRGRRPLQLWVTVEVKRNNGRSYLQVERFEMLKV